MVSMSNDWQKNTKKLIEEVPDLMDAREFNKCVEWQEFARRVDDHIREYVIPQYGDYPDDMIENFTIRDIQKQLTRYVGRMGSGARGIEEEIRDMLKISHYACMACTKLEE